MTHRVVAYDDVGGWVAARLWWMLDVLGPRGGGRARRRHRGLARGRRGARRPTIPDLPPAELRARRRLDAGDRPRGAPVAARVGRPARRPRRPALSRRDRADRPRGRPHPDGAQRAGRRQPGRADGRFLAPDVLASRFAELGADGTNGPVVTSCGSGVSALHHALATARRPACPTRSCTSARTATGRGPVKGSRPDPSPARSRGTRPRGRAAHSSSSGRPRTCETTSSGTAGLGPQAPVRQVVRRPDIWIQVVAGKLLVQLGPRGRPGHRNAEGVLRRNCQVIIAGHLRRKGVRQRRVDLGTERGNALVAWPVESSRRPD